MRLLLWNVNGLRAIAKKQIKDGTTFDTFLKQYDIVVLNETKISATQLSQSNLIPNGFTSYNAHSLVKKGYSGVSIFSKQLPLRRIDPTFADSEGRLVILEYNTFILIGVYVPNAGTKDKETGMPTRIRYRTTKWDHAFRDMCIKLEKKKPLIVLGDMNVAYTNEDVYAPSKLGTHAGFTSAERDNFSKLLECTSLIDAWRRKHPYKIEYTFFDYRSRARERNAGWRIDYALISKQLYTRIKTCSIALDCYGSDHVPLQLSMN